MNTKQLQEQATKAPKFVLFSDEFGQPLYIADEDITGRGIIVTGDLSEALAYSIGYDDPLMKKAYWEFQTGYSLRTKNL